MKDNIKMDTSEMWHENVGSIYRKICHISWLLYFSRYWDFIHNLCFSIPNNLVRGPNCVICQRVACPFSLPHFVFPFHHCLSHVVSVQYNKTRRQYFPLVITFITLLMVKPLALNIMSLCVLHVLLKMSIVI
jgi:hypothetical protein